MLALTRGLMCGGSFQWLYSVQEGSSWNDAYGSYLGTVMVCAFSTIFVSFLPTKLLRRLFPTYIAGLTVFLVGVYLCGVEITNWGKSLESAHLQHLLKSVYPSQISG